MRISFKCSNAKPEDVEEYYLKGISLEEPEEFIPENYEFGTTVGDMYAFKINHTKHKALVNPLKHIASGDINQAEEEDEFDAKTRIVYIESIYRVQMKGQEWSVPKWTLQIRITPENPWEESILEARTVSRSENGTTRILFVNDEDYEFVGPTVNEPIDQESVDIINILPPEASEE